MPLVSSGQVGRAPPLVSSWCFSPSRSCVPYGRRVTRTAAEHSKPPLQAPRQSQPMTVPPPSARRSAPRSPSSSWWYANRAVRLFERQLTSISVPRLAHACPEPRAQPDGERGEQPDAGHGWVERRLVARVGGSVELLDRRGNADMTGDEPRLARGPLPWDRIVHGVAN
jgi:hypothetical protein